MTPTFNPTLTPSFWVGPEPYFCRILFLRGFGGCSSARTTQMYTKVCSVNFHMSYFHMFCFLANKTAGNSLLLSSFLASLLSQGFERSPWKKTPCVFRAFYTPTRKRRSGVSGFPKRTLLCESRFGVLERYELRIFKGEKTHPPKQPTPINSTENSLCKEFATNSCLI